MCVAAADAQPQRRRFTCLPTRPLQLKSFLSFFELKRRQYSQELSDVIHDVLLERCVATPLNPSARHPGRH